MRDANLEGADLSSAKLAGADFTRSKLQGALLSRGKMQGAVLSGAQLQGADISKSQLQGAILIDTQLQGSDLINANLSGALLGYVQLQGASLDRAVLQDIVLRHGSAWRLTASQADFTNALVEDADFEADPPCAVIPGTLALSISCKWAGQKPQFTWLQWVEFWRNQIPDSSEYYAAGRRLSRLIRDADPAGTTDLARIWENLHNPDLARAAKRLGDLACERNNGSGIANRLVSSLHAAVGATTRLRSVDGCARLRHTGARPRKAACRRTCLPRRRGPGQYREGAACIVFANEHTGSRRSPCRGQHVGSCRSGA